jgi:signal transduction histidine kinase/CheY-like chemotaxis protein
VNAVRCWISSLRPRFVLIILIAMLPVAGLNVVTFVELRKAQADASKAEALRLARSAAATHAAYVEGARQLLIALSLLPEVRGLDGEACGRRLAEIRNKFAQYANLVAVRPDGEIFCGALMRGGRVNVADRAWFQRAVKTRAFAAGEYQIGRITGKPMIIFGYPVLDDGGRVSAVVVAALDIDWLNELKPALELPEGATLAVIDRKGAILLRHPDPARWVGQTLPEAPIVKEILARRGEGTIETYGVEGVRRLYAFTPLASDQGTVAYLYVGIPTAAAFAVANTALARGLAALALVALAAMAISWWMASRLVVRDVRRLADASGHWAAGDLDARTGISAGGEIGHLARGFDQMAESLNEATRIRDALLEEVTRHRGELEERVADRTRELEAAVAVMEQAKGEADRANQAKSDFLSRMSHELRTPLTAILGFAQLLEMGQISEAQQRNTRHILKAGWHLLDLINEILDISRIEAGHLKISPEPVRVGETMQETLDLIAPMAAERGIQLQSRIGQADGRCVRADRQRLKQVLLNLMANAVRYNRDGGAVILSDEVRGERLRILVADTGPGISPEGLNRLCVPFERLGAEQTQADGTGLGLALSKRLIEVMGGAMGVESEMGRGSTFWVELPLVKAPAAGQEGVVAEGAAPAAAGAHSETFTVLYIEDNLSSLELIEQLLAHRPGLNLISAMQGRLGLDLAREHQPHLILLDLHLPDIPGEEVLARLRAEPRTRAIPVVVISADAITGRAERLRAAGAHDYLTKPLDVSRFLDIVDRVTAEVRTGNRQGDHQPVSVTGSPA